MRAVVPDNHLPLGWSQSKEGEFVFARTADAGRLSDTDGTRARRICWQGDAADRLSGWERAEISRILFAADDKGIEIAWESFPEQLRRVHQLRRNLNRRADAIAVTRPGMLEAVGLWAIRQVQGACDVAHFTGLWVLALLRLVRGKSFFPLPEFWRVLRSVSTQALPIVSLISFLVGLIISFLGAVVLQQFGAEFAVAYLIGFGMLREMGALMTAIILAGRTGAAYAAQIASMKVNEEIDALETFGISSMDYLVLPRLLALFIMMPLLTVYANVVGVFGGYVVAEVMMDVPAAIFFTEMRNVVDANDFFLGIFKAGVFGLLVGTAGCLRGLQSGAGADAVGEAATRAVVTGITLIIIANAIINWAVASI